MAKKKPVWVYPDWGRARVSIATEDMLCFGLGCPTQKIAVGEQYTLHRIKASGAYCDRAFCTACRVVRQMPPGFNSRSVWVETMIQHDHTFYNHTEGKI
jgi:hypothetical protein